MWIVIGERDVDRGHPVFGPFPTRQAAEEFALKCWEDDVKRYMEEWECEEEEAEREVPEMEVTTLITPEE